MVIQKLYYTSHKARLWLVASV